MPVAKHPIVTTKHAEKDNLDRTDFVNKLCDAITVPLPKTPIANGTIFLEGGYGTGKSFIMNWLQEGLQTQGSKSLVIYFDAWRHEDPMDPLTPLLRNFYNPEHSEIVKSLLADLFDLVSIYFGAPGPIIRKIMHAISNCFKTQSCLMSEASKESRFREKFAAFVNNLPADVSSETPRLIVLVDELDRCRPDYALSFLEKIRHLFDVKGVVFVVAADMRAIETMVSTIYGTKEPKDYLLKFYDRLISLPNYLSMEFFDRLLAEESIDPENIYWTHGEKSQFLFLARLFQFDLRRFIGSAHRLQDIINGTEKPGYTYIRETFLICEFLKQIDADLYTRLNSLNEAEACKALLDKLLKQLRSLSPEEIDGLLDGSGMDDYRCRHFLLESIPKLFAISEFKTLYIDNHEDLLVPGLIEEVHLSDLGSDLASTKLESPRNIRNCRFRTHLRAYQKATGE